MAQKRQLKKAQKKTMCGKHWQQHKQVPCHTVNMLGQKQQQQQQTKQNEAQN